MIIEPTIFKNLVDPESLKIFQKYLLKLRETPLPVWYEEYNRLSVSGDAFFHRYHHDHLTMLACKILRENVKPSYNFIAYYEKNGVLPMHADKPDCYLTIDVCINQAQPWPIYINNTTIVDEGEFTDYYAFKPEQIKKYEVGMKEYILEPGDAIAFSGTRCPHYRNTIQQGNFCHMILFHFVPHHFKVNL